MITIIIWLTVVTPQMLDYDAARSKLRKITDKPSEDPTRLPKVLSSHLAIRLLVSFSNNNRHNKSMTRQKKSLIISINSWQQNFPSCLNCVSHSLIQASKLWSECNANLQKKDTRNLAVSRGECYFYYLWLLSSWQNKGISPRMSGMITLPVNWTHR